MKKLILASAIAAAFIGNTAQAEDAAAAPAAEAPEHVIAYNIGATTDYIFRGISQSRNGAAFSGGVDYTNTPTGLYVGTWVSTISWVNDSKAGASNTPYELDIYGGKRGEIAEGVGYDVGAIYYIYPGEKIGATYGTNTAEVYGQLTYGPAYVKLNYGVTDVIATGKSGSYYADVGANIPVAEGVVLNLHGGYFSFSGNSTANYSDWKIGLTKDFGGLAVSLAAVGTDADKTAWNLGSFGYLGDTKAVLSVLKTF